MAICQVFVILETVAFHEVKKPQNNIQLLYFLKENVLNNLTKMN